MKRLFFAIMLLSLTWISSAQSTPDSYKYSVNLNNFVIGSYTRLLNTLFDIKSYQEIKYICPINAAFTERLPVEDDKINFYDKEGKSRNGIVKHAYTVWDGGFGYGFGNGLAYIVIVWDKPNGNSILDLAFFLKKESCTMSYSNNCLNGAPFYFKAYNDIPDKDGNNNDVFMASDMVFDWKFLLTTQGKQINVVESKNRKSSSFNFDVYNILNSKGYSIDTGFYKLDVIVKPKNINESYLDYPGDTCHVEITPQTKFLPLKSGNKVDVYPGFGKDWSQSGWICTFMPNIPQNEESIYVCSSGLNGVLSRGCNKIEGLYVKGFYAVFDKKVDFHMELAKKVNSTSSTPWCRTIEPLTLPSKSNMVFKISGQGNGKYYDKTGTNPNVLYKCDEKGSFKIEVSRGLRLSVKKEGKVVASKDLRFGYCNDNELFLTVEDPEAGIYDIEFDYWSVDENGKSNKETRKEQLTVIDVPYPETPILSTSPQTCNSPANGSVIVQVNSSDLDWLFFDPELRNMGGESLSKKNNDSKIVFSGLNANAYSFNFTRYEHTVSGCVYNPSLKMHNTEVKNDIVDTNFTINNGNTQTLTCVGGEKEVEVKMLSENSALQFTVDGNAIKDNKFSVGKGKYNVRLAYKNGCYDSSEAELTITDPEPIKAMDPKVLYGTEEGKATIQIGVTDFSDYSFKLEKEGSTNGAVATYNDLNEPIVEVGNLASGKYKGVFTRKNCDGLDNLLEISDIEVFGKPIISVPNATIKVVDCKPVRINGDVVKCNGGSGSIKVEYCKQGENSFAVVPNEGLPVGKYRIRYYDEVTRYYSNEQELTVGSEKGVLAVAPSSVSVLCNNNVAKIDLTVEGGLAPYQYRIGTGEYNQYKESSIDVVSELYNKGKVTFTVKDAQGCSVNTAGTSVSNPPVLSNFVVESDFLTRCNAPAIIKVETVEGGTPPYTYGYRPQGALYEVMHPTESFSISSVGVVDLIVKDKYGCMIELNEKTITSDDITIGIADYKSRLTKVGANDGSVTLSSSKPKVKYLMKRQGETVPDATEWESGQTNPTFSGLAKGDYIFYVQESNGCIASIAMSIKDPFDGMTFTAKGSGIQCNGSSSGSIDVDISDADASMNLVAIVLNNINTKEEQAISYSEAKSLYTFNNLRAGNYQISIKNAKGTLSDSKIIELQEKDEVAIIEEDNEYIYRSVENAKNAAEVSFKIDSKGNDIIKVEYSFETDADTWHELTADKADNKYFFSANKGGVYTVRIAKCNADANNVFEHAIDVLEIPMPTFAYEVINPTNEEETGKIVLTNQNTSSDSRYSYQVTLTPTSGGSPIIKDIYPDASAFTVEGLSQGDYNVSISSFCEGKTKGKMAPFTVSINEPLRLSIKEDAEIIKLCNGASASTDIIKAFLQNNVEVKGGNTNVNSRKFSFVSSITGEVFNLDESLQLKADKYFVKITDGSGTVATANTVCEIRESEPIEIIVDGTLDLPCYESSADLRLVLQGGWGEYVGNCSSPDVTVSGGSKMFKASVTRGKYTFYFEDKLGCKGSVDVDVKTPDKPLALSLDSDNSTIDLGCSSTNSGKVQLVAEGGTPTYTYRYTNKEGGMETVMPDRNIADLTPGNYSFAVVDSRGCRAAKDVTISTNFRKQDPNFRITASPASCKGYKNGSIELHNTSSDFSYRLKEVDNEFSENKITGLAAGKYTLLAINNLDPTCIDSKAVEVEEPDALSLTNSYVVPTCQNNSRGKVTFSINGGVRPWNVSCDSGNSLGEVFEIAGLQNGIHSIKIVDKNGCELTESVSVGNLSKQNPETDFAAKVLHSCSNDASGEIDIVPSDSSRVQHWSFYRKVDERLLGYGSLSSFARLHINDLAPSGYRAVLTDDETGCEVIDQTITIHPKVSIASIDVPKVGCKGQGVPLEIDLGNTEEKDIVRYTYTAKGNVEDSQYLPLPELLTTGQYTLRASTQYCTDSKDFEVVEPESSLSLEGIPVEVGAIDGNAYHLRCADGNDGEIKLNCNGGWGEYKLSVDNKIVDLKNSINGLTRGTHTLTLTDALGCSVSSIVELKAPATQLSIVEIDKQQIKEVNSIANTVLLSAKGGIGGYLHSISMNGISEEVRTDAEDDVAKFEFEGAGVFKFTLTDMLGCQVDHEVELSEFSQLKYSKEVHSPVCFGGSDGSLSVSDDQLAYSYNLVGEGVDVKRTGTGTFEGLKTGNYTLVISNGVFTEYQPIKIEEPQAISLITSIDPSCSNENTGVVKVSIADGSKYNTYKFELQPKDGTSIYMELAGDQPALFNGLDEGLYNITVSNMNEMCSNDVATVSTSIEKLKSLAPRISAVHFCGDEVGKVVGDFDAGEHTYTVDLLRLDNNDWQSVNSAIIGDNVHNWAPEVAPGWYKFKTTDREYGCVEYSSSLEIYPSPKIVSVETIDEVCYGDKGQLKVESSGGSGALSVFQGKDEYERIFGNATNLAPGQYKVMVYDESSQCSIVYPELATIKGAEVPFAFGFTTSEYGGYGIDCNGNATGKVNVEIVGGGELLNAEFGENTYTTRSFSVEAQTAGWKHFSAVDSFGCRIADSVELKEPLPLELQVQSSKIHLECDNTNSAYINLSSKGGAGEVLYAMEDGEFTSNAYYDNFGAGSFSFYALDGNGCKSSLVVDVDSKYMPFDVQLKPTNISCYGNADGSILATSQSGQFTYRWAHDGSVGDKAENLQPGTYTATAISESGCTKDFSVEVSQPDPLEFWMNVSDACPGETEGLVSFDVSGGTQPYSFALNDEPYGNEGINLHVPYGLYLATVTDANKCSMMQSLTIGKKEGTISAGFLVATALGSADTLALVDISVPKPDAIEWNLSDNDSAIKTVPSVNPDVPWVIFPHEGEYQVTMTAHYGECSYVISKIIKVEDGVVSDGLKSFVIGANGIKTFDVYPNPTQGSSRFKLTTYEAKPAALFVYNMSGKLMFSQNIPNTDYFEGTLDFSGYAPGIYVVRVVQESGGEYRELKVVKSK